MSWGEMRQVVRELKKPEVKETYKTLIIDTVDVAADYCQKYVCNQLGIENIGDGGWSNNGWTKYKKEFEDIFRSLTQLGYAVVFISHEKEKEITLQDGKKYQQICSSLQSSAAKVVENMSDIIGYAHTKRFDNGTSKVVLTLRSEDGSIVCGGRFKYIEPEIDFNYDALAKTLIDAIDKEAEMSNNKFVTNERQESAVKPDYDYAALRKEFDQISGDLMNKNVDYYHPKIVAIINKYLGQGKKIDQTTPEQAELLFLIIDEIKQDLL